MTLRKACVVDVRGARDSRSLARKVAMVIDRQRRGLRMGEGPEVSLTLGRQLVA